MNIMETISYCGHCYGPMTLQERTCRQCGARYNTGNVSLGYIPPVADLTTSQYQQQDRRRGLPLMGSSNDRSQNQLPYHSLRPALHSDHYNSGSLLTGSGNDDSQQFPYHPQQAAPYSSYTSGSLLMGSSNDRSHQQLFHHPQQAALHIHQQVSYGYQRTVASQTFASGYMNQSQGSVARASLPLYEESYRAMQQPGQYPFRRESDVSQPAHFSQIPCRPTPQQEQSGYNFPPENLRGMEPNRAQVRQEVQGFLAEHPVSSESLIQKDQGSSWQAQEERQPRSMTTHPYQVRLPAPRSVPTVDRARPISRRSRSPIVPEKGNSKLSMPLHASTPSMLNNRSENRLPIRKQPRGKRRIKGAPSVKLSQVQASTVKAVPKLTASINAQLNQKVSTRPAVEKTVRELSDMLSDDDDEAAVTMSKTPSAASQASILPNIEKQDTGPEPTFTEEVGNQERVTETFSPTDLFDNISLDDDIEECYDYTETLFTNPPVIRLKKRFDKQRREIVPEQSDVLINSKKASRKGKSTYKSMLSEHGSQL